MAKPKTNVQVRKAKAARLARRMAQDANAAVPLRDRLIRHHMLEGATEAEAARMADVFLASCGLAPKGDA